ncbi:PWWP domain-containing DNA repair factor 3A-like [Patiria miniata]|uniref:PWWP domain-containing protein n=1 Tax=Patiria miniata TaxID=46514 RepID=A0A914BCS2_PATMI|nr:PWWP domain-containing DNA repair factor 3A-like [Patiria miniata]
MTKTRSSSSSSVLVTSRLRNGTQYQQRGRTASARAAKEKTIKKLRPRAKCLRQKTSKKGTHVSLSDVLRRPGAENGSDTVMGDGNVTGNTCKRLKEDSEDDGTDSCEDEDLPDIQYNSATAETKVKELVPGTMVWAKSRGYPHWPAVLLKLFSNNKKAWVNYLDQKMQRVQVSLKSMAPFFGPLRSQYIELGKNCKLSEDFNSSMERAEDYLIKQGLGKAADSTSDMSFALDLSKCASPTVSPRKMSQSHEKSPDRLHEKSPDGSPDTGPPADLPVSTNNVILEDEELRIGHPIGSMILDTARVEDPELIERRKAWKYTETRLLKYIRRDTTKNYLLAMFHGKVKSERQRLFNSDRQTDRQTLRAMAGLGPITDDELLSELTDFLRDLYVEHCMQCKDDIPNTSYITEVWLPEAIIFAIQKTRRVGRRNAEKLFYSEGVQSLMDLGDDMPAVPATINETWDDS